MGVYPSPAERQYHARRSHSSGRLRESAILRGYLMARSVAPKRTWNATSKRLSKKVCGKPFLLQMLLLSFSLRRPNHITCEGWNLALPVAGEFLPSRASKPNSFMHPSSGASPRLTRIFGRTASA